MSCIYITRRVTTGIKAQLPTMCNKSQVRESIRNGSVETFSILKTCENCDTIKGHDNEPNPWVPSPLRSSRAQFSELVSMHLCDTTIWGAHPSQPRDIRQPPVNFAGVSAWLYTPVSSWTLWSKLVYQVQDSFLQTKLVRVHSFGTFMEHFLF